MAKQTTHSTLYHPLWAATHILEKVYFMAAS